MGLLASLAIRYLPVRADAGISDVVPHEYRIRVAVEGHQTIQVEREMRHGVFRERKAPTEIDPTSGCIFDQR